MTKRKVIAGLQNDIVWAKRCREDIKSQHEYMVACGFRTGHRLSIDCERTDIGPKIFYTFKCLDCEMKYVVYENFTVREQELIDNLKLGAKNED